MEVSWVWLVMGLVLGAPLGMLVMGALAEGRVQEARSEGYAKGREHERELWEIQQRQQEQRWENREQKWTAIVLELSAAVEKFNPSNFSNSCPVCPPEVERALAAVDLGQRGC